MDARDVVALIIAVLDIIAIISVKFINFNMDYKTRESTRIKGTYKRKK